MSEKSIEELLKKLAAGAQLSEPEKKEMKDYKFWKTQPVPSFDETITTQGPIETKTIADISTEPLPLLKEFEWADLDINKQEDHDEVFKLLYENYVEDADSTFRFKYTKEFLDWALKPPGYRRDWHVGVRVKATGRLIGFIAGIPTDLDVRSQEIKAVEINFICVHKKLRSKRLAPILIKEVTRRVNLQGIFQALYTAGVVLPSPVSVCRYNHRPINWKKLHSVGFSYLPDGVSETQMIAKYTLRNQGKVKNLRRATLDDFEGVESLFTKFQKRYELTQKFSTDELKHWLFGDASIKNEDKVIHTFVVEDEQGKITDFFSFYLLPFTILDNKEHDELGIAYLFYYASDVAFDKEEKEGNQLLKKRLTELIGDALIIAKSLGVDVFNALTTQDNNLFLQDLKFGEGDGLLNYYLFNYRVKQIEGGLNDKNHVDYNDVSKMGVVML
ncbi:Glycylpeptide N-tetradecanoyltransferase [Wickerhamomyces ciferrii]|uniref:Glycylpeptide N-tetradecanoyltransferase n=1 Tax=Wickerhamomyces ciferrii (strain ATCC 14091 / BCRC 22168 / CBS 111 / JCM 3599 / NBRC 0793 / NRRL Y-1031 F-60-10) TaxID=1206466 RepID=K0KIU0_WICCF|nr:Glycylpeptide N-tetradecanoyltransferase [Wickerhamomyces ciferrii]CCH41329.1 Glycylpeptide N-tetradecanoyltransferase [Wickerhamomyces ciferrii]